MNGGGAGMRTGRLTDKTEGTIAGVFAPAFFRFGSGIFWPFWMFRILRKENTPRIRVGYMYGAWDVHATPYQERLDVNII